MPIDLWHDTELPKCKGQASIDCRERGSHARGKHHTQDTSRPETATVKEEEEADARVIAEEY